MTDPAWPTLEPVRSPPPSSTPPLTDSLSLPGATATPHDPPQPSAPPSLLISALDRVKEAVCITDTDLQHGPHIVYVNAAFVRITGYPPEEVLGRTPRVMQGPKTDPAAFAGMRAELLAGRPYQTRVINYRRDGSDFLVALDIVPLRNAHGRVTNYLGLQRDITEERAAALYGQLFREALDQANDAVAIVDDVGCIKYANPTFLTACGRSMVEVFGVSIRDLTLAPRRARTYREILRELSLGNEWRGEYETADIRGEPRKIEATVTRVAVGELGAHFIVSVRDVTVQRRLEYIADAQNLVENVGYVFASLRHELGNPINSIKTALMMMRQCLWDLPPERVENYLDRLLQEVGRVEYLLRSLQSFDTSTRPTLEAVPIAPFLDGFARMVRPDVELRDVELTVDADASVGSATAEPRALHQVMLNLVTNAIDAVAERSGARIHISAHKRSHVVLRVTDNGPGIPPERRAHVFRPFHTTKPRGTGLGLAISRKLVTFMRGTIDIESTGPEGTTFAITLDPHERDTGKTRAWTQMPPPPRGAT
ncbi:MAG: PAS domain-containing protein [Polyangiaceae bacterium]